MTDLGANDSLGSIRSAARRVALRISIACGVAMICVFALGFLFILYRASLPVEPASEHPGSLVVRLDPADLVVGAILASCAAVILAGGVGWLSARSAMAPLGEALAKQKRFVQDASHELRTPLAILDARVQLVQRDTPAETKAGRTLVKIRQDTASLTGMVEDLLLAATATGPQPRQEVMDLSAVVAGVATDVQVIAAERGVQIVQDLAPGVQIRAPREGIRRVALALADNALNHTPDGGQVTLALAVQGQWAVLTVTDTGAGISGVAPEKIFERFVRADAPASQSGSAQSGSAQSGSAHSGGSARPTSFGIGLALVRELVTAAGGTVEVAQTGPQGTSMRAVLPRV
ncbi:sensor histidine kinase [Psychromicrobium xiongbiense]|uniref:sensor histidine kinase n=1 Tax=Psychromicrobium xiongbiense TaxID=3051184 RepID=UPI002557AD31|nr:HAMP domain-containing sensor histidine kinase [Psychromicrobium sp. YIM S02556]